MPNPTILLVDDDALQLSLVEMQLHNLNYTQVVLAQSGVEALAAFERLGGRIDIIVSDLFMPDMDGLVLMRHLAQRGFCGSFILLSSSTPEILTSGAGLAQAHGLDLLGVLSKPCAPEQLGTMLGARKPRKEGSGVHPKLPSLTLPALTQALSNQELVPWYQPKTDIHTGKASSVEALARWPLTSIGPGTFVPAMEACGLSDELFFAMARAVVQDLVVWRRQGVAVKVAINLSMDTALNLAMPEQLLALVLNAGLKPADLIIEVTESQLMVQRKLALETLTRLSMMGFILSIDDFGTGFSSLVQLLDLPFKELKIDSSFVQRALSESKAEAILRLAIAAGASLDMHVVAEGVETTAQLAFIRECGGSIAQGYHFAHPMPFDACTTWLQQYGA
ncbi:EAL domain-containing response regulator [Rhodoferax aquaticus]|uniref:EAL domain-containing protein n=1 Tax=Rhodoferax aquaticus TaxID=2527691 RepID=A0A515EQ09_9BURK|nr:EAL domain-containing response regulator [Rhodoferax aquaticus]QDL54761.1 EAL domain-containing protein [Rhodoferax aquaticus]